MATFETEDEEMYSRKIRFKHMGSCLSDQEYEYQIDETNNVIRVTARQFDSSLFMGLVESIERDHKIKLHTDDNDGWSPARPTWKLTLDLNGVNYIVDAARLMNIGGNYNFSIVLMLWPWTKPLAR
jgi:hypothetical protein